MGMCPCCVPVRGHEVIVVVVVVVVGKTELLQHNVFFLYLLYVIQRVVEKHL